MLHRFTSLQCLYIVAVDSQKDYHIKSDSTPDWGPELSPTRPAGRGENNYCPDKTMLFYHYHETHHQNVQCMMYTKYPDLLSKTNWRDQRSYYNVKDQKKLHERCHERMQNEKLSFGHEISFIWKTNVKDAMRTFDWAWYCPERATDPPRRQPPPTRRRTMPPRRTTPPRTRRPGQYTQHLALQWRVCSHAFIYLNCGDQKFWQHCVHYLYSCCHDLTV